MNALVITIAEQRDLIDEAARAGCLSDLAWYKAEALRNAGPLYGLAYREAWRGIATYAQEAINEIEARQALAREA